jgi:hypothetical protein
MSNYLLGVELLQVTKPIAEIVSEPCTGLRFEVMLALVIGGLSVKQKIRQLLLRPFNGPSEL